MNGNYSYTINTHQLMLRMDVPFTPKHDEIIYFENKYQPEVNEFIQINYDKLKTLFESKGLQFVYFPYEKIQVTDELCDYLYVRNYNRQEIELKDSKFLLHYMAHLENITKLHWGFAKFVNDDFDRRTNDGTLIHLFEYKWFDVTEMSSKEFYAHIVAFFSDDHTHDDLTKWPYTISPLDSISISDNNIFDNDFDIFDNDLVDYQMSHAMTSFDDVEIKKELEEIKEKLNRLRINGIREALIREYLKPDVTPSRLKITNDYRILLVDLENKEIIMEPIAKAVYLLFLKHPEGIVFKELDSYRCELDYYYACVKGTYADAKVSQTIVRLCNPLDNSINEKCSRIRNAFLKVIDDSIATHYYIKGNRGEVKSINLDRSLIIFEGAAPII